MTRPWDQTVFATHADGRELVRYDRASQYRIEAKDGKGKRVTMPAAIAFAIECADTPGGRVRLDVYGSTVFSSAYRKARKALDSPASQTPNKPSKQPYRYIGRLRPATTREQQSYDGAHTEWTPFTSKKAAADWLRAHSGEGELLLDLKLLRTPILPGAWDSLREELDDWKSFTMNLEMRRGLRGGISGAGL